MKKSKKVSKKIKKEIEILKRPCVSWSYVGAEERAHSRCKIYGKKDSELPKKIRDLTVVFRYYEQRGYTLGTRFKDCTIEYIRKVKKITKKKK